MRLLAAWAAAGLLFVSYPSQAQNATDIAAACAALDGALIVADDGHFLGKLANEFDSDSIFNEFGKGNEFGSDSIWNDFSRYGGDIGSMSAFDTTASRPPMLIKNRQVIGALTANKAIANRVDPIRVARICYQFKPPNH